LLKTYGWTHEVLFTTVLSPLAADLALDQLVPIAALSSNQ
jgi:hypothetical protein